MTDGDLSYNICVTSQQKIRLRHIYTTVREEMSHTAYLNPSTNNNLTLCPSYTRSHHIIGGLCIYLLAKFGLYHPRGLLLTPGKLDHAVADVFSLIVCQK